MIRQRWRRLAAVFRKKEGREIPFPAHAGWRMLEASFLFADLLAVPDLLMLLNRIFKPNTRRLSDREIAMAREIYGDAIDWRPVRVDERAHIGCRQYKFAYVGFQVINCWGPLSDAHLIHELVHVWQFQKLGSVYIPRALWAQRSPEAYNYGGIRALEKAMADGRGLSDFNYEQQGDIVADYFCLKNGLRPRWCAYDATYLPVFQAIIRFSDQ
ncbi:MAG: hypothetical protein H6575_10170 [Lewinellaceae bacterium]|nr:hypothetical protein [Lewinellaceae bacterium]